MFITNYTLSISNRNSGKRTYTATNVPPCSLPAIYHPGSEFVMYHFWGEVGMYMLTHMGKSDNNVQELILSFHHIGSRDQTQADQLDSKYL